MKLFPDLLGYPRATRIALNPEIRDLLAADKGDEEKGMRRDKHMRKVTDGAAGTFRRWRTNTQREESTAAVAYKVDKE